MFFPLSFQFEELTELMELNSRLLRQIRDDIERICSQDYQTLNALLRTADRLVQPNHSLYPFFQVRTSNRSILGCGGSSSSWATLTTHLQDPGLKPTCS